MIDFDSCKNSCNPINIFSVLKYKRGFSKGHPDYFWPDGLLIFTGPQGSGKTLSAVSYVEKLLEKYPKAILVTNLLLNKYPFDNERVFPFENGDDLSKYSNDDKGVIFLIDEIHLYFNSLASKNINPEVMTQIAQQRKQRKHIVATSQVFGRMAKPLREQFSSVIVCSSFLNVLQVNRLVDRDSIEDFDNSTTLKGQVKKKFYWFHNPAYYKSYDTYFVIKQNNFVSNEEKRSDIYGIRSTSSL